MSLPYILLYLYIAVCFACFWKLFQKAGRKPWEGIIPVYNVWVWTRITGKPWWWMLLMLVPGVNLLMLIIMNVNLSIVFGQKDFKQHVIMAFLPWVIIPQLTFQEKYTYQGIPPKKKRGFLSQWGDAILFAIIAATVIRTFTFEAFTIPTPSMEKSLLVGDYLFVSKLSYGPRMPMTPISFPFAHHTLPLTKTTPSFVKWFAQPFRRLPGFGDVERGDAVVFNFPEGDTVVANFQNQSYYQLIRDHGREKIWNENYRMPQMVEDRVVNMPTGGIMVRPLDKKENYIKRCVGIAGDELQVINGVVHINGEPNELAPTGQYDYEFTLKDNFNQKMLKTQYDVSPSDIQRGENGGVAMPLTNSAADKLRSLPNVVSMERQMHKAGHDFKYRKNPIFPNDDRYDWSEDNFGPLWIPNEGGTIELNLKNLPLYERAIRVYEHNDLQVREGKILINGEVATSYTFNQNYYWLMGDNRHRSQDSRFWGFVPEDHVVGKAVFIWLSKDPYTGFRWKRMFSFVK